MYTGYNLKMDPKFQDFYDKGNQLFSGNKKVIQEELDKFVLEDGSLDGSKMQETWFPQINADIFLSHSHADEANAIALAGWIKETFNLSTFIDSCVWGYADELLEKIDNEFCWQPKSSTYNYKKRNQSTSHVHMMLSTALTKLMDRTECVFILNTPNSIQSFEVVNKTKSPWIYYEIGITKLLEKKKPSRQPSIIKKGLFENSQDLSVKYELDMKHLIALTQFDLDNWEEKHLLVKDTQHPMDTLYMLTEAAKTLAIIR
ncbi:hypothetical protein CXK86_21395 [Paenibacillus sp. BGI2013]|uniref:hypothetical protein n=1 Tax=Paenibacillus TaxID=44249 RepID=UPI00096E75F4|nr:MULTISPECIES: hypothetical protein [Paenibacillus]OMF42637.1 hypothetical protein BK136_17750 [Paenibacillus amylolyticus]PKQ89128.1 hypothetical protein CXK86_21395 [Paenibacillus sp. BGI2013]